MWSQPPIPPSERAPLPISPVTPCTVAALTAFLDAPTAAYRMEHHVAFVRDAYDLPALSPSSPAVTTFLSALAAAWRDRIDNRVKESLWRLAANAFPGARFRTWTCPCGLASPSSRGRRHTFWDCPVARAVRSQLAEAHLPGGPVAAVACADVWRLRRPSAYSGPMRQWSRIALVAVAAMEHGRRVLWARSVTGEPDAVAAAGNLAAARFWFLLGDLPPV